MKYVIKFIENQMMKEREFLIMKNCRKNAIKSRKGITLISLVVTIIVLLILAGISISMLSGDNSILQKAIDAKTNTERATVIELAQGDVLEKIAENKGEAISETQLKAILSKYFEEFDDVLSEDLSETTVTLTSKAEYGGYNDIALSSIYNGKISIIKVSTIRYGNKTATTVGKGDEITIGTEETRIERFIVVNNNGTKIIALPCYNITLDEITPVQSESAKKTKFATTNYITRGGTIDMEDSSNVIQKYISAYANTLRALGATGISTRIPLLDDVSGLDESQRQGSYWLGTARYMNSRHVGPWYVMDTGVISVLDNNYDSTNGWNQGVRPVIEISL